MGRTNWQKKADSLEAELASLRKEHELVNGLLEVARTDVEALKQQLVDAERQMMIARLEGGRDAIEAMLDTKRTYESARNMGLVQ